MARKFLIASSIMVLTACASAADGKKGEIPLATTISKADKELGAKAHPDLLKEFGGLYEGSQVAYVERVGRNIAAQSSLSNNRADFTVSLLNSPVNNAFAIPGGYVYITRQLMALCNDEAEMAGVLGHEVGHVAAMHSQRRQKAATRNAIGGTLLQVLTGAVLGNEGLGGLIQQGIGTGSQLLTLKFSRSQENEADTLGIRYLNAAGYDPRALSSMLSSLAAQSALDARLAGQNNSLPEWASTHPDPGKRVTSTLAQAQRTGSTSTLRNRDAFLAALDGVLYGDDPEQGVIEGSKFLHPKLKIGFTTPSGFSMSNGTAAVTIAGSSGQAQFSGGAYSGNLDSYVASVFAALAKSSTVPSITTTKTTINGMPVAYATQRANTQSGAVDATVLAYEVGPSTAYHFVMLTAAGSGLGPFTSLVQSFRKLSTAEIAAIKPRKVDVVTVKSGDTVTSLANRMAYADYRTERFLVLNGMRSGDAPRAGQKVKIVTY